MAFVALTGGGSRHDILSLPILRFAACMVAAIVLLRSRTFAVRTIALPAKLLAALALVMVLQLVPLPPEWWSALPLRGSIATIDTLIGLDGTWRPITLSPVKTVNSLAALSVPAAGLFLLANMPDRQWRILPWVFVMAGAANAALALLQITARNSEILYLYSVTNPGEAVGLFANRNHTATFLAAALWIDICLLVNLWKAMKTPLRVAATISGVVMGCALLFNASRLGLLLLALVAAAGAIQVLIAGVVGAKGRRVGSRRLAMGVTFGAAALAAGLIAVAWFGDRVPALARISDPSPIADLRSSLTPILFDMAARFQPYGVGFGAFEYAYGIIEPPRLVGAKYVNQAHNDWLQFVIEGGAAAVAILVAFLSLLAAGLLRSLRAGADGVRRSAIMLAGVLFIAAIASAVDYPLRTPVMMVFMMWPVAALLRRETPGYGLPSLAYSR